MRKTHARMDQGKGGGFLRIFASLALVIGLLPIGAVSALAEESQGEATQPAAASVSDDPIELVDAPETTESAEPEVSGSLEAPKSDVIVTEVATDTATDDEAAAPSLSAERGVGFNSVEKVTNLVVNPSTGLVNGQVVTVNFDWSTKVAGTSAYYFHDGDVVKIPSNIGELLSVPTDAAARQVILRDPTTQQQIGVMKLLPDGFEITFNATAEAMKLTSAQGSLAGSLTLPSKSWQDPAGEVTKALTVGDATANLVYKKQDRTLTTTAQGALNGVTANSGIADEAGNNIDGKVWTINNDGDKVTVVITTAKGADSAVTQSIKKVVLYKADGTTVEVPFNADGDTITINAADLPFGNNKLVVEFDPDPINARMDDRMTTKQAWGNNGGVDTDKAQRTPVWVGAPGVYALCDSKGQTASNITNVIVEDTIPGGAVANFDDWFRITAIMPDVKDVGGVYIPQGRQWGNPPSEWVTRANLKDTAYMPQVVQNPGESLADFRARVSATPVSSPYQYGVYTDTVTGSKTIIANFGSPGVNDGVGPTYTDLFGDRVTSNEIYNTVYGNGNAVGGKAQMFWIDLYTKYYGQEYTATYTNTATVSYNNNGTPSTATDTTGSYLIKGTHNLTAGGQGTLAVQKYDPATGNPIQGAEFCVQTKDADGNWVQYTDAASGKEVKGTTDAFGRLDLGVMIDNEYRLVEDSVPAPYDKDSAVIVPGGDSAGHITADGLFTVTAASQTKGFVAVVSNVSANNLHQVLYDANGGTGTLTDPSQYREGSNWSVLSPGTTITRDGYVFDGWNDAADGTGTSYAIGSTHAMGTADVTLFAQWKAKTPVSAVSPNVTKAFTADSVSRPDAAKQTFSFTITPAAGNPAAVEGLTASATQFDAGTVAAAFGDQIKFSKAGAYSFTVAETVPSPVPAGYTYDTATHTWEVTVSEAATSYVVTSYKIDGTEVAGSGNIAFTNTFVPAPTTAIASPTVNKDMGEPHPGASFTFTATADAANPVDGVQGLNASFSTNIPAGNESATDFAAAFGNSVTFSKAGTYKFTIAETAGVEVGYEYDTATYTWTVVVSDAGGQLSVDSAKLTDAAGAEVNNNKATFTNHYNAEKPTYTFPTVTKTVSGAAAPTDETFQFKVISNTFAPLPTNDIITIDGAGTANFDSVKLPANTTYTYHVFEVAGTAAGWTYDDSDYQITLKVTNTNGTMSIESSSITKNGVPVDAIVFNNEYTQTPTSIDPPVTKQVTGDTPITNDTFSFKMVGKNGAPMPADATGDTVLRTLTGAGQVEMGQIDYARAGVFEYEVSEIAGANANYTYDNSVFTMTVTVADDGQANLVATPTFTKNGVAADAISFTNTFASGRDVVAEKTVDKQEVKPGEELAYTIKVRNTGTSDVIGLWVKDMVPANTTLVSADDAGVVSADKTYVSWFIPTLAPGEEHEATFTMLVRVNDDVPAGTTISNTAKYEVTAAQDTPDFTKDPTGGESTTVESKVVEDEVAGGEPSNTTPTPLNTGSTGAKTVKTGDPLLPMALLAGIGIAAAAVVVISVLRRKRQN